MLLAPLTGYLSFKMLQKRVSNNVILHMSPQARFTNEPVSAKTQICEDLRITPSDNNSIW